MKTNPERIHPLNDRPVVKRPAVYWMSRDQRVEDNWALIYAQEKAIEIQQPLLVVFCLVEDSFLNAPLRHYDFMLKGLESVEQKLMKMNIPFVTLRGEPGVEIPKFINKNTIGLVITDFDPLRIKRKWKNKAAGQIKIPMIEADAHNIVPCWQASDKQEYAAYTIRPKIHRQLNRYLTAFPKVKKHPFQVASPMDPVDWSAVQSKLNCDASVGPVDWIHPGEKFAKQRLKDFIEQKLSDYDIKRNDPNEDGQSHLSPYLHFGQISAQRIAWEVQQADVPEPAKEIFLEELIVRRELSDNFCFYQPHYDSSEGFPDWAQTSLHEHESDPREYLYSGEQFELAETHDPLWNAAQNQMVRTGKMHGYMRMYWAKKILAWSSDAYQAMKIAIRLNDKYSLDGRDPNGYAGIAWSIGGVHDRAWPSRPVFGKIRYMSYGGAKSKFKVNLFINKYR